MSQVNCSMSVRIISQKTSIIDIRGDVTAAAESALTAAYAQASQSSTKTIIFNFGGLEYMNSGGIGLLVTFLIRANRHKQHIMARGLSEHYRHIFELTRLDEAIAIYGSEAAALDAS